MEKVPRCVFAIKHALMAQTNPKASLLVGIALNHGLRGMYVS